MPQLMTGSCHSIDMVMSDSIDTAPWRSLSRQARGPPESLNNSARGVSITPPRSLIRGREGGGSGEGGDEEVQRKERSGDVMT